MQFFELLQISLDNGGAFSRTPTVKEWEEIYDEAERQAVTGILLQGIEKLPAEQRPSQEFLLQWIGIGQMIEQQNHLLDERCVELLGRIQEAGSHGTILKGQGIALLYDEKLRALRQSGDMDVNANWDLLWHYPADVIWAPVWFVWHKCWKLKTKVLLAISKN